MYICSAHCPMHYGQFAVIDFGIAHFISEPFIYIFIINVATQLIIPSSINVCLCVTDQL